MPHPEREHELMIEVAHFRREVEIAMQALATTLRERDAEKAVRVRAVDGEKAWCAAAQKAESERDALRAENERLREVVQAGIGVHGDPCSKGEECQFMRDARAALAGGGDRG